MDTTGYGQIVTRQQRVKAELLQRDTEWEIIQEVFGRMAPKDRDNLYEALSLFARGWLADNDWGELALEILKDIDPTESELEELEREAREDAAYLYREWARQAI